MKNLLVCIFCFAAVSVAAEELASASRWNTSVKPYKFELQGELVRTLNEYRDSVNLSGISLEKSRQIRAETERLRLLLRSRGYYQASIESEWPEGEARPDYQIILGDRFTISSIELEGNFQPVDDKWQTLKVGDDLSATDVVSQQTKLKSYIEDQACYYNINVSHKVVLDEAQRSGALTLVAYVADPAEFGTVSFTGEDEDKQSFLLRSSGIKPGQCYKASSVDSAVISLLDVGLYSRVKPTSIRTADGNVDVNFRLTKKKKRTLSASIGWETEAGPIAGAGWLHRDLFSSAQSLELELSVQETNQTASATVIIPSFFDRRNRLNWENTVEHDTSDYETYTLSSTTTLERQASSTSYYEYGIGFSQENENVDGDWDNYHQIRLPLLYRYDTVEDPFDPETGYRLSFELEPVWDIDDNFTPFLLTGIGVQTFYELDPRLTIANRVKWSSLWYGDYFGSTQENIPESEWLTAGGSTSIRGYAYESIELAEKYEADDDDAGDIAGATQRWISNNELRFRLSESWGLVTFFDVGSVSEEINPLNQDIWYAGAGAGIRFYTSFTPIRLDVAFPLNPRDEDESFIVYVSLGQAF
ncbi:autotransporter assembly complex protein TamA [Reinekea marinisedimentorum]|uniref:Outer membrane translocation and assembly module TamA n=1 Tax=Reinekea marinisedimentorum TaxID=230495 RepID=A0A4R3I5G8_9GAMM|nr:BamA/TamA family outer membrane protein [Reinekea marinisedimentorum]TCS40361.1 outer membrane translocation and assembly module TamA [Reinekea marinisedimentorum]